LAYNYALTRIEASRASVFINGVPVVTAVGAWFILGEKLTLLQVGGGALVLLAVFISNIPAQSRANSTQEQLP
jgi:drug/metabolite transporter (DMT)-like permease